MPLSIARFARGIATLSPLRSILWPATSFFLHYHDLSVKEEKASVATCNGGTSSYAAVNDVVLHVVSVFICGSKTMGS